MTERIKKIKKLNELLSKGITKREKIKAVATFSGILPQEIELQGSPQEQWFELLNHAKDLTNDALENLIENAFDSNPKNRYLIEAKKILNNEGIEEIVSNGDIESSNRETGRLPEKPYRSLLGFERKHSSIFFGRNIQIEELYKIVTHPEYPPILLFYGQSGVGKSSLLEAGLFPRLQSSLEDGKHRVLYLRREKDKTFLEQLQEKEQIQLPQDWLKVEKKLGKPLIILLDQVEELFTQSIEPKKLLSLNLDEEKDYLNSLEQKNFPRLTEEDKEKFADKIGSLANDYYAEIQIEIREKGLEWKFLLKKRCFLIKKEGNGLNIYKQPREFEELLDAFASLFQKEQEGPQGKLILSFRIEWLAEVKKKLKETNLQDFYLEEPLSRLDKNGIIEAIEGPSSSSLLKIKYKLKIEADLPFIIAEDLLQDQGSAIAPTLQVLLFKMWEIAEKKDYLNPTFSLELYRKLKKQGIFLKDFLEEQMKKLNKDFSEVIKTGLVLDILEYHTSSLATSKQHFLREIEKQYSHQQEILHKLLQQLKELYLLVECSNKEKQDSLRLSHDTLGPVIQNIVSESVKPGQEARRILESKKIGFVSGKKETLLGFTDLSIVKKGRVGMRTLEDDEKKLVKESEEARSRLHFIWFLGACAIIIVLAYLSFTLITEKQRLQRQRDALFPDTDINTRVAAIYKIGEKDSKEESTQMFIKLLEEKNQDLREIALINLKKQGGKGKTAFRKYLVRIKNIDEIKEELKTTKAIDFLLIALKDTDSEIRRNTALALGEIGREAKEAVPALIKALKDTDSEVRCSAASALGEIGKEAKEAIPALIKAFEDKDNYVRENAALALGDIGKEAKEAIPALIKAFEDKEDYVRRGAALALGDIGKEAKEAIPALIKALKYTYSNAISALGEIGKEAIPALIKALKNTNSEVRGNAALALRKIGKEAKEAIPALIKALKDTDSEVRENAALALGEIGKEAKEAIPALIKALKDTDSGVRFSAARALGDIGKEAKEAIPALIKVLQDENNYVRENAALALGRMGKEAIPALIKALKNTNSRVRRNAALALGKEAKEAIPALIKDLEDKEDYVRRGAASALGEIGKEAKEAIPALIKAFEDKDNYVGKNAAFALGRIGKEAIPDLIKALKDANFEVRVNAALALRNIGKEAKEAIPALIKALQDTSYEVRVNTARALGEIGKEAKEAIPALIKALQDAIYEVRVNTALALGEIGKEAKEAIPALIKAFKDTDFGVRVSAALALGEIGKEAIPALIKVLKNTNSKARGNAVEALGKIGREAIPDLIKALKDEDNYVRLYVASALGEIGKETIPALIKALSNKNYYIRKYAITILGRIGKDAKAAIEPLKKAAENEDFYIEFFAHEAIKKIEEDIEKSKK